MIFFGGVLITKSRVMIILGSKSDINIAKKSIDILEEMQVSYDIKVASAHRTHERLKEIIRNYSSSIEVFIAIAGLAAHLPGVIASLTTKPVIAVPVEGKLDGLDALLSCTEMDLGTPVATVGIDRGDNAALLSCQIMACNDEDLKDKLKQKRLDYEKKMRVDEEELIDEIAGAHYVKSEKVESTPYKIKKIDKIPEDTRVVILSANYLNMKIVHNIKQTLDSLKIPSTYKVISATRDPGKLEKFIHKIDDQVDLYIGVSSLSCVLTGAICSHTTKPVIGVPCNSNILGIDSLITMVQMPPGVPTATMGIDAGENAAIFVAKMLSVHDEEIRSSLIEFIKTLHRNNYYE